MRPSPPSLGLPPGCAEQRAGLGGVRTGMAAGWGGRDGSRGCPPGAQVLGKGLAGGWGIPSPPHQPQPGFPGWVSHFCPVLFPRDGSPSPIPARSPRPILSRPPGMVPGMVPGRVRGSRGGAGGGGRCGAGAERPPPPRAGGSSRGRSAPPRRPSPAIFNLGRGGERQRRARHGPGLTPHPDPAPGPRVSAQVRPGPPAGCGTGRGWAVGGAGGCGGAV